MFRPGESRLFDKRAAAIIEEMGDRLDIEDGETAEQALWRTMVAEASNMLKGQRVRMCQYGAWVEAAFEMVLNWKKELFYRELLALEADMMHGKVAQCAMDVDASVVAHADETNTTSAGQIGVNTKLLRQPKYNNCVLSLIFM